MEDTGMSVNYGMPAEPTQADHDLNELTAAAANIAAALDHLGASENYTAHEVFCPQLDRMENKLHNMIQSIRGRHERSL